MRKPGVARGGPRWLTARAETGRGRQAIGRSRLGCPHRGGGFGRTPHAPAPRSSMSKTPSVAIVGAGPGGLSAAVLLAASGAKVTVFESQQRLG
ncbi:MAG: NAD(P)-binding protein, partial [Planctomycetota bacterium]